MPRHLFNHTMPKTYATPANAKRAVEKALGNTGDPALNALRYVIAVDSDGRFFPVFIGENAVTVGVHHVGFAVAG